MFDDASAMISMMAGESDADELVDRLGAEHSRLCSAVSAWETVAGLCRTYLFSVPSPRAEVQSFVALNDLKFAIISEREFDLATQAYADFGKGGTQPP
jgi:ribonuclease VapC